MSWRRNQIAITAVAFIGFASFTLVMPFLALYVRELGVTRNRDVALWTGAALGITPLITALCAPLWGRVGDRFGNKILVQRSLLSFVVIMVAMAYVTRPWHLVALRAIQGLVAGYGGLALAMAARSAPRHQIAQAIGSVQTAQRMGPAVGPIIGGILARAAGLRTSFVVSAAVYAAAFVLLTVMYREPPRDSRSSDRQDVRVAFRNILAFENFLLLTVTIFCLQLVDRSFGPVLPLHLDALGYVDVSLLAGVLFSVLAVAGALGHQLAAALLRRMSARLVIATSSLAGAAGLIVFAVRVWMWALAPSMGVAGLSLGTAATAAFSAAGSVIPRDVHGASFGLLTSASLMGTAVSPVLSGIVGALSFRVVFIAGALVLATLAFAVRRVMVERNLQIEPTPISEE
jgi:DHA1 family multidrug resistance protein-like MFS transporter